MFYLYLSLGEVSHYQEKLYDKKQNILTIEQCKLLYTLQNKIDKYINKRKTLELIRIIFGLIKYYLLLFPQHLQYRRKHFSHNFFSRKLTDMLKLK